MTDLPPRADRPANGERRAAAREKARRLRDDQAKRDRRRGWLTWVGIAVGIAVIGTVIGVVISTSVRPPQSGPANMSSDGILIGTGLKAERSAPLAAHATPTPNPVSTAGQTVTIVEYVDYLSPLGAQFTAANSDQLSALVKSGAATVEIHPLPLTTESGDAALHAVNAAACVANFDPDNFWTYHKDVFASQPPPGGVLSDGDLQQIAVEAGATSKDVAACIADHRYDSWAQDAAGRALEGPLPNSDTAALGTNTLLVVVNGKTYTGSPTSAQDFRVFIQLAQSSAYSTASPQPSATSTPSPSASTTVGFISGTGTK